MLTRKRALAEVSANGSRESKPAKSPKRDPENASEPAVSREKIAKTPFVGGPAHVSTRKRLRR
jgi:hypothetical protein